MIENQKFADSRGDLASFFLARSSLANILDALSTHRSLIGNRRRRKPAAPAPERRWETSDSRGGRRCELRRRTRGNRCGRRLPGPAISRPSLGVGRFGGRGGRCAPCRLALAESERRHRASGLSSPFSPQSHHRCNDGASGAGSKARARKRGNYVRILACLASSSPASSPVQTRSLAIARELSERFEADGRLHRKVHSVRRG
jgi:hypothetical protein